MFRPKSEVLTKKIRHSRTLLIGLLVDGYAKNAMKNIWKKETLAAKDVDAFIKSSPKQTRAKPLPVTLIKILVKARMKGMKE